MRTMEKITSIFLNFFQQNLASSMLYPFFFTILIVTLLLLLFKPFNNKAKPPSPPKVPILGNLHQIGLHPHLSLQFLAQTHGPIMLLHLGNIPVLVVSSPAFACEIMRTHDLVFSNRPKSKTFEKLLYNYKDVSAAPYGEYWRQMKSICVLHLLSNKRVQSFRVVREEETNSMIDKIKESSHLPVNLSEIFMTLTNDVVCRLVMGRKYDMGVKGRKFRELLREFVGLLGGFNLGDYIPWLAWVSRVNGLDAKTERVASEFDEFLDEVVEEHMTRQRNTSGLAQSEDRKDFVDVLLWIQKENIVGFPIDRVAVKALILDMFAAGTDTTYTVLEWAMTELLRHPKSMKELQSEVWRIVRDKSSEVKESDLDKMQYLKAVIKETLRLHPPIPLLVPRESTQDTKIKGYDIAAGTQVIVNAWAIGRDPLSWERPNEFWPERFLKSSIDFRGRDFELIPFGAGRRICPGILFAMSINELALANIVHKFDWALPGEAEGQNLDMTESTGLTIHRKYPLLAVATPH